MVNEITNMFPWYLPVMTFLHNRRDNIICIPSRAGLADDLPANVYLPHVLNIFVALLTPDPRERPAGHVLRRNAHLHLFEGKEFFVGHDLIRFKLAAMLVLYFRKVLPRPFPRLFPGDDSHGLP